MSEKVTQKAKRALVPTRDVSKAIREYYTWVKEGKAAGKKVLWAFGVLPRETWNALNVPFIMFEHLPLMLAAKQVSANYIDLAVDNGFSRDICAYHTSFIGCALSERRDPYAESIFVEPDIIAASNYPCMPESKTFLYLAKHFNSPFHFIDAPINIGGANPDEDAVEYFASQLEQLLAFLEKHGYSRDEEKLKKAVELSKQALQIYSEIDEYRKAVPTPMGFVDGNTALFPVAILSGTQKAVELLEKIRNEVKERYKNKIGVIPDEKLRLLWLGVPPFYNLGLLNYPEKYGAVIVKCELEYINTGVVDHTVINPSKPMESLAKKNLIDFPNPTFENRINLMVQLVKDYKIDGVIAVNKRGCRNLPPGIRLLKDAIYQEHGVPTAIFDLDGIDTKEYNDAQAKSMIDSFIATLI